MPLPQSVLDLAGISPLDIDIPTAAGLPAGPVDVLVVGAGPAGAAAALAARRAAPGARVVLVDKARFPRDKTCGDGVAPFALDVLRALGVDGAAVVAGTSAIPAMRLRGSRGADTRAELDRPDYVVPRVVLDRRLVAAAVLAGVEMRHHRVRGLTPGPVVDGCRTRVVIAADGAGSTLRRALGIERNPPRTLALALRGYAPTPAGANDALVIDMVERGWPAYAWHFPTGTGISNIGFGTVRAELPDDPRFLHRTLAELLPATPAEPGSLRAAHLPLSTWRPHQPDGPVLLAGDAASLVNPLTGEGIFYAVLSGALAGRTAAASLHDGTDPGAAYRRVLAGHLGRHLRHTGAMAALARRPSIVDAAIRGAGRSPALFDAMVELGLGRGLVPPRLLASVARHVVRDRLRS